MNFSFLSHMKMRTRVLLIIAGVLVLTIVGVLGFSLVTGKLGIFADTNLKTVIVSGKSIDPATGKPIADAIIALGSHGIPEVSTKTDSQGNYSLTITVDVSIPAQNRVIVSQFKDDLTIIGEGSSFTLTLPEWITTVASVNLTQDFSQGRPGTYSDYCKTIYYVEFCTNVSYYFTKYASGLDRIAHQVVFLRSQTGAFLPSTIYLVPQLTFSGSNYAGAATRNYNIFLRESVISDATNNITKEGLTEVTHEFGHLLDYFKGGTEIGTGNLIDSCYPVSNSSRKHCPTSATIYFYFAMQLAIEADAITGYATTNNTEFFAEYFEALLTKTLPNMSFFAYQERLKYVTENYMLTSSKYTFSNSVIFGGRGTKAHNALMYIYKFVAKQSNANQYFPGEVYSLDAGHSTWYWDNTIGRGLYMDKAVVSVRLWDHAMRAMEDSQITIGDGRVKTRLYKSSGVFADGGGDLFDITGTAVGYVSGFGDIFESPPFKVDIGVPAYYHGAAWLGQYIELVKGSNVAKVFSFRPHRDRMFVKDLQCIQDPNNEDMQICPKASATGATGQGTSLTNGKSFAPIVLGQMTRYPSFGTPGGTVYNSGPDAGYVDWIIGGAPGRNEKFTLANWNSVLNKINIR